MFIRSVMKSTTTKDFRLALYLQIQSKGFEQGKSYLRSWSFLLALEESEEGDVGDLDNLESDTGDITDGVTGSTETSDKNLKKCL